MRSLPTLAATPASPRLRAPAARLGAALLLGLSLSLAPAAQAAPGTPSAGAAPELSAQLDFGKDKTATFGAPFTLTIEARHAPEDVARLPEQLDLGPKLTERSKHRHHLRKKEGDRVLDRYRLELLSFATGEQTLPSIPVAIGSQTLNTEPLGIFVQSTLTDEEVAQVDSATAAAALPALEQLAAPDPEPVELRVLFRLVYWLGAAILLLSAAGLVISMLLKRRQARPVPGPPPRRALSHEIALESLRFLKEADFIERGQFKAFYAELSQILRRYVGQRYRFESLDLTVDELRETLACMRTPGLDEDGLAQTLQLADLVKFAKFQTAPEAAQASLDFAFQLVRDTGPQPKPEAEAAPAADAPAEEATT